MYGIQPESKLHLVLRLGGPPPNLNIPGMGRRMPMNARGLNMNRINIYIKSLTDNYTEDIKLEVFEDDDFGVTWIYIFDVVVEYTAV